MDRDAVERRLCAILSADVVGYSRLMADDEVATVRTLTAYRDTIRLLVEQHRGRIVDSPGDNVLAEFPSPSDAVRCSVEVQRVIRARNLDLAEGQRMQLRIGVHLGEVLVDGERIYGDGVNVAARLEALAEPGGVYVSAAVHEQVGRKLDLAFDDLGARKLKNILEPVRVLRVRSDGVAGSRPGRARKATRRAAVGAIAVAVLVGVAVWLWSLPRSGDTTHAVARFRIDVLSDGRLADRSFPPIALSRDGRTVAYVASADGTPRIFLRPLERFDVTPVVGSDRGVSPFFSPDGSWLGFFSETELRVVPTAGGVPVALCRFPGVDRPSASWGPDGMILFSRGPNNGTGLYRVNTEGGTPAVVTTPRASESWHGLPQHLPDGDVLFTVATAEGMRAAILKPDSGEWEILEWLGTAVGAHYLASGHLVFGQPGRLMAVPWRPGRAARATPVPVVEGVYTSRLGLPYFRLSDRGALLYVAGEVVRSTPVILDRMGGAVPVTDDEGAFQHPRFSPDGTWLALDRTSQGRSDIYVYDLERGRRRRLTHTGFNIDPFWLPDGRHIAFRSIRRSSEAQDIYQVAADGSGDVELLVASEHNKVIAGWTRGGELLVYTDISTASQLRRLWVLEVGSGNPPERLIDTPHNVGWGAVSPDDRLLAYVSDESGRNEVWVRRFSGSAAAEQVSSGGGMEPVWSAAGDELYYRWGEGFFVVAIEDDGRLRAGAPRELFRGAFDLSPNGHQHYDLSPDGERFVAIDLGRAADLDELRMVLDWSVELRQRIGAED